MERRTEVGGLPPPRNFVIDRHGTVQWVNVGDAPFRCNPALLYQLAEMGRLQSAGTTWP